MTNKEILQTLWIRWMRGERYQDHHLENERMFDELEKAVDVLDSFEKLEPDEPKVENDRTILDLNLSQRAYHCLRRAGINTIEDLEHTPIYLLKRIKNLGEKSLDEINEKLREWKEWEQANGN